MTEFIGEKSAKHSFVLVAVPGVGQPAACVWLALRADQLN